MKGKTCCPHRNESEFKKELLTKIFELEKVLGELTLTSGLRCVKCNEDAGGVPGSAHTTGEAIDVAVPDSKFCYNFVKQCFLLGINRIGFGNGFQHIDISKSLPQNVMWNYYNKGKG